MPARIPLTVSTLLLNKINAKKLEINISTLLINTPLIIKAIIKIKKLGDISLTNFKFIAKTILKQNDIIIRKILNSMD